MKIPFIEPRKAHYIYINPRNNKLHLLLPVVSGNEIGLDNTCKSVFAVQEFFGKNPNQTQKSAFNELIAYQKALEFDISLIEGPSDLKMQKEMRLQQIKEYRAALKFVQKSSILKDLSKAYPTYPEPLQRIMGSNESNIHSMVLRPANMDGYGRSSYPVFSLERTNTSVFQHTLSEAYKNIPAILGVKEAVITQVLTSLKGPGIQFKKIQDKLTDIINKELGVCVDFTQTSAATSITEETIRASMNSESARDYIEALLGYCAPCIFDTHNESPFSTIKNPEHLSISTQFFWASVNIYCRMQRISATNFGKVLDGSRHLSEAVAALVTSSIGNKELLVEDVLLDFIAEQQTALGFTRALTEEDRLMIKKRFTTHFKQIEESPHFDEFTLLDDSKPGPFLPHQRSICLNFAEFIGIGFPELNPKFFEEIRADFKAVTRSLNGKIPHLNQEIYAEIDLNVDTLIKNIHDEEQLNSLLKELPNEQKDVLMSSSLMVQKLLVSKFLHCVAQGQQKAAEKMIKENPSTVLLNQSARFTDYSGRTFNCTALEYAYWAKDIYMCLMLLECMDEDTKAEMLKRCNAIEENGLDYTQNEQVKSSSHFDLTPLITALQNYADGYNDWYANKNWNAITTAWFKVGIEQCDIAAHIAHEYCTQDHSFHPIPDFNKKVLRRNLNYYNWDRSEYREWFPLDTSTSSGLGVNLALYRASRSSSCIGGDQAWPSVTSVTRDALALSSLDKARTQNLIQLREALQPKVASALVI